MVITSVPHNATVVGVPGRIVEIRNPDTDTVEKLPDPVWEKLQNLEGRIAELEKSTGANQPTAKAKKGAIPSSSEAENESI